MIDRLAAWLVYDLFGLDPASRLGTSVHFFFYDTVKIILLLIIIGTAMGIVNAYFPIERLRRFLSHRRLFGLQYLLAALFGAVTPFCSCSSIPLFIGFVKGGIPLGVTFAFLITSPLVNEVAVALLLGSFGVRTTLIYVASGLLLGTVGGFVLGRLRLERHQESALEIARWPARVKGFGHVKERNLRAARPLWDDLLRRWRAGDAAAAPTSAARLA